MAVPRFVKQVRRGAAAMLVLDVATTQGALSRRENYGGRYVAWTSSFDNGIWRVPRTPPRRRP